ncbi:MAG: hypothetical protein RIF46_04275, partial [Cyclobacteriaceae bacterium]
GGVASHRGLSHFKANLSDSIDSGVQFHPFKVTLFEQYFEKNTFADPDQKRGVLESGEPAFTMFENVVASLFEEDGSILAVYTLGDFCDRMIARFDPDGDLQYVKYMKSSIYPFQFTRSPTYEKHQEMALQKLGKKHFIILNGGIEEVGPEYISQKAPLKKYNEAIILYRIDEEGIITRQNLMEFESREDPWIFFESKSFKIDENRILLFTTKFEDVKQQRFIEISTN